MIIEQATAADLDDVVAMRREASDWLATIGIDQWREPWPNHEAMVTAH